mmetsp:Transcript_3041/g.8026  ORF Transcript_3041/g.8026 Transcript_3041/m.8026 type:complete len:89 (+) Transcript_3041:1742-2008(+)
MAPTDLMSAMAIAVPTTNLEDADDDDDDDGRPLSRDELKARSVRGLARRNGEADGSSGSPSAAKTRTKSVRSIASAGPAGGRRPPSGE